MGREGSSLKLRLLALANALCLAGFMVQFCFIDMNGRLWGIPEEVVGWMQSLNCLVGIVVGVWCIAAERRPRTLPVFALCVYLIAIGASVIWKLGALP